MDRYLEDKKQQDKILMSEICSMIRDNCLEGDLVRLINQY